MRLTRVILRAISLLLILGACTNGQRTGMFTGNVHSPESPSYTQYTDTNSPVKDYRSQNIHSLTPQSFRTNVPGSPPDSFGSFRAQPYNNRPFGPSDSFKPFGPPSDSFRSFGAQPPNNGPFGPPSDIFRSFGVQPPNNGPFGPPPGSFDSFGAQPSNNGPPDSFGPYGAQPTKFNSPDPKATRLSSSDPSLTSSGPQGSSSDSSGHHGSSSGSSDPHDSSSGSSGSHPTGHRPSDHATSHHSKPHSSSAPKKDSLKDFRIVCLFNSKHSDRRGFSPAKIDASLCTHINYEFAMLDPKTHEMITGEPDLDIQQNFFQEAIDLKKSNPSLKVLLSLGGWADSTKKYSEMAADESKRKNFIEKAISFLKAHEFDGMDMAWEYPNCWQGAIGVCPKDKENFVTLLKEMKPEFEKNGCLLSVSVGAIKREVEAAYDVPAISATVDYINVMTYDMHGPWESKTGHHTQFEAKPEDSDPYCNVKGGMKVWSEMGADKKKLNMGLAFYGKTFTLEDTNQCEMGAPTKGIGEPGPDSNEGGFLLYNEICQYLNSGNWTEKEDKKAGFYAYSGDQWACYDPPMMVVRKSKFVVEDGLGGVLLKDLSGDDYKGTCFSMPFPLLKMIRLEMVQRIRRLHL